MNSVVRPKTGARPNEMMSGRDHDHGKPVGSADLRQHEEADRGKGQPGPHQPRRPQGWVVERAAEFVTELQLPIA